MIKLIVLEDELDKIKKDKVITEQIDIKGQNSAEKDDTSKDAAFKDNNLNKVSESGQNPVKCKEGKTKTRETKNPVFIFGAEAGKSLLEKGKSEAMIKS